MWESSASAGLEEMLTVVSLARRAIDGHGDCLRQFYLFIKTKLY